jgi:hypothetical protein
MIKQQFITKRKKFTFLLLGEWLVEFGETREETGVRR